MACCGGGRPVRERERAREREREREAERQRGRAREKERERKRDRDRDRERETDRADDLLSRSLTHTGGTLTISWRVSQVGINVSAVKQTRHIYDSQGRSMALAFKHTPLNRFELFLLRSEAVTRVGRLFLG